MAQGYRCDWPDHDAPADVLVTMLAAGDVSAYCGEHYMETMRGALALLDGSAAEAEATDDAAVAVLEGGPPPLPVGRQRRAPRDEPPGADVPREATPEPAGETGAVEGEPAPGG